MIYPVVMYGPESWDHKESWIPKDWYFQTVVLEKTLEGPLIARTPKQLILKEINPDYSPEGLLLKLQYFDHLIWRANSLEKTLILGKTEGKKRRRWWQRMQWLDSITDSMDMNLSKPQEIVENREAWHGAVHGVAKSQNSVTEQHCSIDLWVCPSNVAI